MMAILCKYRFINKHKKQKRGKKRKTQDEEEEEDEEVDVKQAVDNLAYSGTPSKPVNGSPSRYIVDKHAAANNCTPHNYNQYESIEKFDGLREFGSFTF